MASCTAGKVEAEPPEPVLVVERVSHVSLTSRSESGGGSGGWEAGGEVGQGEAA